MPQQVYSFVVVVVVVVTTRLGFNGTRSSSSISSTTGATAGPITLASGTGSEEAITVLETRCVLPLPPPQQLVHSCVTLPRQVPKQSPKRLPQPARRAKAPQHKRHPQTRTAPSTTKNMVAQISSNPE
jgi:hypothetical protein